MRRARTCLLLVAAACLTPSFAANEKPSEPVERLNQAAKVFDEVMNTPDNGIPKDLLDGASCVIIIPGLKKAGLVIGGQYGKGVLICRGKNGVGWTGPTTVRAEGGSFGFQIGASEVDVVMLVMNQGVRDKLIQSGFTLGADAGVAAGPVGRNAAAATDVQMHAQILSWSRSRGVFAGAVLQGSTLRRDDDDNKAIYGKYVDPKAIVNGEVPPPPAAKLLIATLNKYSPKLAQPHKPV
ncbi:MAG TPA: lipid-binding SYLF domain-containing protein [Bryobacterales bacterium]|jgi:lipid-binding SYLF domain-containing protein|nr:lipid-binding SYLF domain-containing protein [Bryobacterales bacterium]